MQSDYKANTMNMWGNGYYGNGYPMMGYNGYGFGSYELAHIIFSIFWAVVLIAVIITAVRFLRHGKLPWHGRHGFCGGSALSILRERYAKGEIDRAEFEEKKKDLNA